MRKSKFHRQFNNFLWKFFIRDVLFLPQCVRKRQGEEDRKERERLAEIQQEKTASYMDHLGTGGGYMDHLGTGGGGGVLFSMRC